MHLLYKSRQNRNLLCLTHQRGAVAERTRHRPFLTGRDGGAAMALVCSGIPGLRAGREVVDNHLELSRIDQARHAPQQVGFGRSTVPQRAQEAAPSDSDTLSSRGNQRYEGGLSCWIIVNRS